MVQLRTLANSSSSEASTAAASRSTVETFGSPSPSIWLTSVAVNATACDNLFLRQSTAFPSTLKVPPKVARHPFPGAVRR
jgi:hypothetical protein